MICIMQHKTGLATQHLKRMFSLMEQIKAPPIQRPRPSSISISNIFAIMLPPPPFYLYRYHHSVSSSVLTLSSFVNCIDKNNTMACWTLLLLFLTIPLMSQIKRRYKSIFHRGAFHSSVIITLILFYLYSSFHSFYYYSTLCSII